MAWRYRILGVQAAGAAVSVRVAYFDDAEPTVILERSTLQLSSDTTRQQARAEIIATGQRLRDVYQARRLLLQDVGSEGAVT